MKTLPSTIVREKNRLHTPYPWIVLIEVSLGEGVNFYFCSNNEDVTFGGRTYTAFPFYLDATRQNSKAEIPTISLKVCNVLQALQAELETCGGGVGADLTIKVVNAGHLDADYSELEMPFTIMSTECAGEWVTFNLGAASPLRRRFPPYRYIALHCNWRFKSAECLYTGSETFCDRSYNNCRALGNTHRFGGYRGLNLLKWRLV